jgi:hypothetical protein
MLFMIIRFLHTVNSLVNYELKVAGGNNYEPKCLTPKLHTGGLCTRTQALPRSPGSCYAYHMPYDVATCLLLLSQNSVL